MVKRVTELNATHPIFIKDINFLIPNCIEDLQYFLLE